MASAGIYLLGCMAPDVLGIRVGREGTFPCDVDVLVGVGMSLVEVGVGVVVDVGGDVGVLVVGCGCEVGVGWPVELEVGRDSVVVVVSVVVVLEEVVVVELVGRRVDRGGGSTEPRDVDAVMVTDGGSELGTGITGADSFVGCWLPKTIAATVAKPVAITIPAPASTISRFDGDSGASCSLRSIDVPLVVLVAHLYSGVALRRAIR